MTDQTPQTEAHVLILQNLTAEEFDRVTAYVRWREAQARAEALHDAARMLAAPSLPRHLGPGAQATRRYLLDIIDRAILAGETVR